MPKLIVAILRDVELEAHPVRDAYIIDRADLERAIARARNFYLQNEETGMSVNKAIEVVETALGYKGQSAPMPELPATRKIQLDD